MNEPTQRTESPKPPTQDYQKPRITVMDEKEVLQAFQITSAGASWWTM